ncbi:hypothetical protein [Lapillicoccus sp.]|uniref:hypothetical protein n=1 Tax=Lapillicoccus sp. TaxID=1909287 RepID=UPI0032648F4C
MASPRPDTSLEVRARVRAGVEDRIDALVTGLVPDRASLISAGETLAVRALNDHRDLTIATNNPAIPGAASSPMSPSSGARTGFVTSVTPPDDLAHALRAAGGRW